MAMDWIDLLRLHEAIGFIDDQSVSDAIKSNPDSAKHFIMEASRGK